MSRDIYWHTRSLHYKINILIHAIVTQEKYSQRRRMDLNDGSALMLMFVPTYAEGNTCQLVRGIPEKGRDERGRSYRMNSYQVIHPGNCPCGGSPNHELIAQLPEDAFGRLTEWIREISKETRELAAGARMTDRHATGIVEDLDAEINSMAKEA